MSLTQKTETLEEELSTDDMKLPICETTLLPVLDEYTFIHHNAMEVGVLKYIEQAP